MHGERIPKRHPQSVGDDLGRIVFRFDQNRELVSADAGQRVGRPDASPEPVGDGAQQFVTRGMAELIVDLLEVVEVDEDEHESPVVHRLVESLAEHQPVGQSGERIVVDLMCQAALGHEQLQRQQPLRAHRHHLPCRDEHDHRHPDVDGRRRQTTFDQHVEGAQHHDPQEPDVGQHRLHPVHDVFAAGVRRLRAQFEQGERDHQRSEDGPDATPQISVLDADRPQVGDQSVGRRNQHHAAREQQEVRAVETSTRVRHHHEHRHHDDGELQQRVGQHDRRVLRARQHGAVHHALAGEYDQDGERRSGHQSIERGHGCDVAQGTLLAAVKRVARPRHQHHGSEGQDGRKEVRRDASGRRGVGAVGGAAQPPDHLADQPARHRGDDQQSPPPRDAPHPARDDDGTHQRTDSDARLQCRGDPLGHVVPVQCQRVRPCEHGDDGKQPEPHVATPDRHGSPVRDSADDEFILPWAAQHQTPFRPDRDQPGKRATSQPATGKRSRRANANPTEHLARRHHRLRTTRCGCGRGSRGILDRVSARPGCEPVTIGASCSQSPRRGASRDTRTGRSSGIPCTTRSSARDGAPIDEPVEEVEPDYRFTLANERTFLAWIRTALALIAGGVALVQLVPRFGITGGRHGLSVFLVAVGGLLAALAMRRWQRVQTAMRRNADLPTSRLPVILTGALLTMTILLLALMFIAPPGR